MLQMSREKVEINKRPLPNFWIIVLVVGSMVWCFVLSKGLQYEDGANVNIGHLAWVKSYLQIIRVVSRYSFIQLDPIEIVDSLKIVNCCSWLR